MENYCQRDDDIGGLLGHWGNRDCAQGRGIEFFGKIGIYYLHERAWQAIPRGHVRPGLGGAPELKTQRTQCPEGQA